MSFQQKKKKKKKKKKKLCKCLLSKLDTLDPNFW
jgi:hypothetical protein